MRTRGRLAWSSTATDRESTLRVAAADELTPHDEAVFLLHIAAEIEHSLMVQYLYAAFSLGDPYDPARPLTDDQRCKVATWKTNIIAIAKQEMGHWGTVHDLLLALGSAPTFDREDFPYRSEFYPFPFALGRLTKDALAKYVCAEMPPLSSLGTWPEAERRRVQGIMRRAAMTGTSQPINRVGALYERLRCIAESLPSDLFCFDARLGYEGLPGDLSAVGPECQPPACNPLERVILWPIDSKKRALEAIDLIARQGEAADGPINGLSHFEMFLDIYTHFPETNPQFGILTWMPSLPVPDDPTTAAGDWTEGQLNSPLALAVGTLFNLRYRLLLHVLFHYYMTDRAQRPGCKTFLARWALDLMKESIGPLALHLTVIPRQLPDLFVGGERAVAGAPFELPYSVAVSPVTRARWYSHLDVLDESRHWTTAILQDPDASDDLKETIQNISEGDLRVREKLQRIIADPQHDCPDF